MPTQTPSSDDYLRLPTGRQVYDALMADVEPELVSANLPQLDAPYTSETPQKRASRYERYRKAFEKYDRAFQEWMLALTAAVQDFNRTVMRGAEEKSRGEEAHVLNSLEEQITDASAHSA